MSTMYNEDRRMSLQHGLVNPTQERAWGFMSWLKNFCKLRFTVMLIPHSERRILNFQISVPVVLFIAVLLSVVIIGFLVLSTSVSGAYGLISEQDHSLGEAQANLDAVLDELKEAFKAARDFDSTLVKTLNQANLVGTEYDLSTDGEAGANDLSAFLNITQVEPEDIRELQEIQRLTTTLRSSVEPLTTLGDVLQMQNNLLADIPNLWPLASGHGHVTMEFGPNRHPQTNQWYLHKGIDIAGTIGVPALASANGKVVEAGYNRTGYGNYVLIRHKYGFRTRYSHLQNVYVTEGEEISQGDIIGTLGTTGISTGPHLDFQIILGTDVIDPSLFLRISRREFKRWEGNRY